MPKSSRPYGGGPNRRKPAPKGSKGGGSGKMLAGFAAGVMLTLMAVPAYFYFGKPPVAVTDKPALWEHLTETVAVQRRMRREGKAAPFAADEDAFEGAARTYRSQCAQCHGTTGQDAVIGSAMVPRAPQFFGRDRKTTAAHPAGELYWATAFAFAGRACPRTGGR